MSSSVLRKATLVVLLLPFAALVIYKIWPAPRPPAGPVKQYKSVPLSPRYDNVVNRQTVTFPIGTEIFTVPEHYILESILAELVFRIGFMWPEKLSVWEDAERRERDGLKSGSINDVVRIQVMAHTVEHREQIAAGTAMVPLHDTAEAFDDRQRLSKSSYVEDPRQSYDGRFRAYMYQAPPPRGNTYVPRRTPNQSETTYFELLDSSVKTPKGNPVFAVCNPGRTRRSCYIRFDLNGNEVQVGFGMHQLADLKEIYLFSMELLNQFRGTDK